MDDPVAIIMAGVALVGAASSLLVGRAQAKSAAVDAASKLIKGQQERIDQLHKDVVDSECQLRQARADLAVVTERLNTVERELAQTRAENELLKGRIVELEAERQLWEEERKKLQAQITRLSKEVKTRGLSDAQ